MAQSPQLVNHIYLDACATTPPSLEVISCVNKIQKTLWANPSSLHHYGLIAAEMLERSRQEIASCLSASPDELIFTSGATESNHLAILGCTTNTRPGRILISAVEHPAVTSTAKNLVQHGWTVEVVPVDSFGVVDMNYLESLLSYPTKLVSIIWGQSEIGTIQPVLEIGTLCRDKGILFHTDATQILNQGLFKWNELPIDLLSASAHKFHGPKGVGFLLAKENVIPSIEPLQVGGGQQNGIRGGTEPLALIAGMSTAIKMLTKCLDTNLVNTSEMHHKVYKLTTGLRNDLKNLDTIRFTGHPVNRLGNHISMLVTSVNNLPLSGRAIVRELSKFGIYASSGSACSSGRTLDSAVLTAINVPAPLRQSGLRFSLGSWLDEQDLTQIPELLSRSIMAVSNT